MTFPPLYNLQNAIDKLPEDDPIRKIPKHLWKEKLCLKMNKSIYGLKQAPKAWYDILNKSLIDMGFKPLVNEPCIYIFTRQNGEKYYLFLYVDDTLIAGKDKSFIDSLVRMIQSRHSIKVLGEPNVILGLKLTRCSNGNILIDQNQYIKDVAARFGVVSNPNKLVRMPCTAAQFKRIEDESKDESLIDTTIELRPMVGSLMYASLGTRPDITYFVNYISRYLTKPTVYIKKIVLQTINYLLDTLFIYLICFSDYKEDPQVVTFADAGIGSELTRKGITAGLLKCGKTPVEWNSTKQSTYSLSTAETEYKSLSDTLKTTLYLLALFEELGLVQKRPLRVYEDNTATIAMSNNPIINKKSKHIELAFHHFKYHVQRKIIALFYVASKNQEADILTKIVGSMDLFYSLIKKIFNLPTIVLPSSIKSQEKSNQTFMISSSSVNDCQTVPVINRYLELLKANKHINDHGYGYHNSNDWESNNYKAMEIRESAYQQYLDDEQFPVRELLPLANILEHYVQDYSRQYVKFYPCMTEQDREGKLRYPNGLQSLKDYHQFMEENVFAINNMRQVNKLCTISNIPNDHQFNKTEIEIFVSSGSINQNIILPDNDISNSKPNGSCNMVTSTDNNELNEAIEQWLSEDEIYQQDLVRINSFNLSDEDKEALRKKPRKASIMRRDASLYVSMHEEYSWLENDVVYNSAVNSINQNDRYTTNDRQELIAIKRREALTRRNLPLPEETFSPGIYQQLFPDATDTQPSAFTTALASTTNERNRPKPKTPPKQPLHRLHRNSDEPVRKIAANAEEPLTQNLPNPQVSHNRHHHHRLSQRDKDEFIHLVHSLYPETYSIVIDNIAMIKSTLDEEAKTSFYKERQDDYNRNNRKMISKRPIRELENDEDDNHDFDSDENSSENDSIIVPEEEEEEEDEEEEDKDEELQFPNLQDPALNNNDPLANNNNPPSSNSHTTRSHVNKSATRDNNNKTRGRKPKNAKPVATGNKSDKKNDDKNNKKRKK